MHESAMQAPSLCKPSRCAVIRRLMKWKRKRSFSSCLSRRPEDPISYLVVNIRVVSFLFLFQFVSHIDSDLHSKSPCTHRIALIFLTIRAYLGVAFPGSSSPRTHSFFGRLRRARARSWTMPLTRPSGSMALPGLGTPYWMDTVADFYYIY